MQMWRGEPNIPFSQYWEKVGVARLRVHSDFVGVETPTYKNICPPEFISGSYQRCISSFNENTFLRSNYTLKTGKMLKQVQHDRMGKTLLACTTHTKPSFRAFTAACVLSSTTSFWITLQTCAFAVCSLIVNISAIS